MTASPVNGRRDDGDPPTAEPATLVDWLRGRTDRQLATLLTLRPELALPAPADIVSLAARITVRSSTGRAIDGLDAAALRVLQDLVRADAGGEALIGDDPALAGPIAALLDRALLWGEPGRLRLAPGMADALGPYPDGLGRPAAQLLTDVPARLGDPAQLADVLAGLDADERAVLDRLAAGPPVGTLRPETTGPARRLLEKGLLVPTDPQRVELPREVGLAVRAGDPVAGPPAVAVTERPPDELDRLGTTAVLETLRLVDTLAESWGAQAPAQLRAGGLGVRELRRTARDLGVDEAVAALIIEVTAAAGLINSTSGADPVFLPTAEYDTWHEQDAAHRWLTLAGAWLAMTRQPSLSGRRGERDRVITPLSPDAERGGLPVLRRQLLDVLTDLAPGANPRSPEAVLDRFAWNQPRRAPGLRPPASAVLAEADHLGVTAAGGLTGYTRTLLAGSSAAAAHALTAALPEPVDHFLVQPDLTMIVPGPPAAELAIELGLLADLESTGGASVYRLTAASVRRALDAGRTGAQLLEFVDTRSRTPVPQALHYLIEDSARRHGILRSGRASAYLRSDDETLLTRVLSDRNVDALGLRRIAPTVVVTDAPVPRVLEVLRAAGFAPAAELPGGDLVTIGAEAPRAPSRAVARGITARSATDSDAARAELVRRIRSGDALAGFDRRVQPIIAQTPGVTSATTMDRLRRAVREERLVWFGAAEADGSTTGHTLQPISLAAGTVRGYERGRSGLVSYPVHRITAIRVFDVDETDPDDEAGA